MTGRQVSLPQSASTGTITIIKTRNTTLSEMSTTEWKRMEITFKTGSNNGGVWVQDFRDGGTGSAILWGKQLEVGHEATSFIYEGTRAADILLVDGGGRDIDIAYMDVEEYWNTEESTLFVESETNITDYTLHNYNATAAAFAPNEGRAQVRYDNTDGLQALGYKVVNSDDAFENAMKKAGMEMNPDNIFSPKGQELRGKAKRLTGTKEAIYLKGRLGLVVDGTGKDPDKIAEQAKKVKALGYDVAMIFVNTDLDTAIKRDAMRARTLGAPGVTEYWKAVQRNIGKFQRMFGKPNFLVVDNSEGKNYQKETLTAYRDATKFTNKPVGKKAKKWIEQQKKRKTR